MATNTGGAVYAGRLLDAWERNGEDDLTAVFSRGQVPEPLSGIESVREIGGRVSSREWGGSRGEGAVGYMPEHDPRTMAASVDRIVDLHLRLPGLIKQLRPEVVFFPGNSMPVAKVEAPAVAAVQLMLSWHYPRQLSGARRLYARYAVRHIAARARRIIVPSSALADDLMRAAGARREQLVVVPQGVDLDAFAPDPAVDHDPTTFLFVSKPWDYKGLATTMRALADLRRGAGGAEPMPARLLVADGGITDEQRAHLSAYAAAVGAGEAVDFMGRAGRDELPGLYRRVCALVVPSAIESFGMMYLEAAATGCPVIAGRGHGIDETIGPVATQVAPHSHRLLADAMRAHVEMTASERAEHARELRAWAMKFPWSRTLDETRGVLSEAARL